MRFITEDTNKGKIEDPLSLNLYTYCKENPIQYFDPTGHMEEDGAGGGGVQIAGIGNPDIGISPIEEPIEEPAEDSVEGEAFSSKAIMGEDLADKLERMNLNKVAGQAKTIEDIISDATETTNGKGVARNFEKSGGSTLEIKVSNSKVYKVRY